MTASVESVARFRVVLLYDRLALAGRAMATYRHLARALADDFRPDLRVWQLEAALSPEYACRAGDDLAAAELVVIAVGPAQPCPTAFLDWWTRSDGPRPHGIIALAGPTNSREEDNVTWGRVLRSVATEIHPGVFLCDAPDASGVGVSVSGVDENLTRPSRSAPLAGESLPLTAT